jgi:NAD(P)-dependent dehydrogenase (short-subunit alcohol dehydrogenase family)
LTKDYPNKVALVTGANRGIGLEVAKQLAKTGNSVILGSRSMELGEKAAESFPATHTTVVPVELDVTIEPTIARLVREIESRFGRLDVLVNNAGVLIDETDLPSETKLDTVRKTLETNLLGAWRLCQACIPIMKKNGYGRIVNVSSGAGALSEMTESLYAPAYSISKTALNALTVMLASEFRGSNILVNAACPGWVRTDMGGESAPRSVEEGADTLVWLATLPDGGPTGGLFRDRTRIEW